MSEQKIAPVLSDDEIAAIDPDGLTEGFARAIEQAVLARVGAVRDQGEFTAWLEQQMPPGTIISNAAWWAPRIIRALKGTPAAAVAEPLALEKAWRAGWAACRDAEYVGNEAENDGWHSSQTFRRASDIADAAAVADHLQWAIDCWDAEVRCRPLVNVHRRTLDDTWRQVIRHFGGNPDDLVGPDHDSLIAANPIKPQSSGNPGPLAAVERDAERWQYLSRKLCLTGNGDGTCSMHAINLPCSVKGWPEPGEVSEFCGLAIDAAIAASKEGASR